MKRTDLCSKCRIPQTIDNSAIRNVKTGSFKAYCYKCDAARAKDYYLANKGTEKSKNTYRRGQLMYNYGLTVSQFEEMMTAQNGCCAICGKPPTMEYRKCTLHVDHCHTTGKIRGLLCNNCNLGIGNLKHDISILLSAITYLS